MSISKCGDNMEYDSMIFYVGEHFEARECVFSSLNILAQHGVSIDYKNRCMKKLT